MPATELNFSLAEYAERLGKVRAAMERRGLELLVVSDPSNMAWLSGYDGWSFYVHQCLVVAHDGEPLWFGRGMDAAGAARTVYMDAANIVDYPDSYVQTAERHPMDYLCAEVLAARGWDGKTIGVEMDNYYFSAAAFQSLQKNLPRATLRDATALVNWQRAVKSPAEIAYMRRAARIVEKMHARALQCIAPGVRKCDVVAEIYHAAISGADGHGGDYPAIAPMVPSGADAAAAHLTWDDKPFVENAGTFFEIAGCHKRYHCPLCRTVYLGKPPQKFLDAEKAAMEGVAAALEAARPGNTCEQVAAAFQQTINRHGFTKDTRCGYSIGLSYPPDWGERTMSFRPGDKSVLKENMTFHLMPALWMEDWGLEITESILITAGGAECFCDYPRGVVVKG